MARPKFKVTPENRNTVEKMAAVRVPMVVIAKALGVKGIDRKTLEKHFSEELERGRAKGAIALMQKAFQIAMDGNVPMLKYFLEKMDSKENGASQNSSFEPPCSPSEARLRLAKLFENRYRALHPEKLTDERADSVRDRSLG